MKHNAFAATVILMATIAMTGCNQSFPGIAADVDDQITGREDLSHVPINITIDRQSLFANSDTRGSGSFDSNYPSYQQKLDNSVFRIYAFRATKDVQGPMTDDANLQSTMAGDTTAYNCLVDNSLNREGDNTMRGVQAKFKHDEFDALTDQLKLNTASQRNKYGFCYSSTYQDVGYNFFGYYLDDASVVSVDRQEDHITETVQLDGRQDIVAGYAAPITESLLDSKYSQVKLTDEQRNTVANIGFYSTYAGYLGINPILQMKHMLTRFRFQAYSADTRYDPQCQKIVIDKISILAKNKGDLTVASRNTSEIGMKFPYDEKSLMVLPDTLQEGETTVHDMKAIDFPILEEVINIPDVTKRPLTNMGECLMVAPDTSYELHIHYTRYLKLDNGQTMQYPFEGVYYMTPPADSDTFAAGNTYLVKLAIYGRSDIRISFDLTAWGDGGSMDLGGDE